LTAEQKEKMKAIRQSSEEKLNTILTPEQQAKFKAHQRHRRGHHKM
jgi:Spy/CpxP family protein refolding chaperone